MSSILEKYLSTLKNASSHPQSQTLLLVMDTKVLEQSRAPDTENIPGQRQPVAWWKDTHLIKLNIGIVCLTFLCKSLISLSCARMIIQ